MIPEGLRWLVRAHPDGGAWLTALPDVLAECTRRWSLRVGDAYPDSFVSLVMPATDADGAEVVLKIQFPHPECEHEAAALEAWDGDGAIRLLHHAPELHALLLERCAPGTHLSAADPEEALTVMIGLLPRLWKPASEPFRSLSAEAIAWAHGLPHRWERAGKPCERDLVDSAVDQLQSLAGSQREQVLLHQDLHADNVLAAAREPWLVIDPKPLVGERAFAIAPIVRSSELGHSRDHVVHRLDRLTSELGLDRDRARGWAIGQTFAWAFEGSQTFERHVETVRWLLESG